MKILITNIVDYKDKDGIINGFNETGNFSILAKGILNPKSRNAAINNEMTIADIELSETSKSKYDVLKSSEIVFSPMSCIGEISKLAMIMLLNELILKCLTEDEKVTLYKDICHYLKNIKKDKFVRFDLLQLVAKILKVSGYTFDVDSCATCGSKKDIVTFDMSEGGFICRNCIKSLNGAIFNKDELIWLRRIFTSDKDKMAKLEEDIAKSSFMKILKTQIIFIEDNFGIKIKNAELLVD